MTAGEQIGNMTNFDYSQHNSNRYPRLTSLLHKENLPIEVVLSPNSRFLVDSPLHVLSVPDVDVFSPFFAAPDRLLQQKKTENLFNPGKFTNHLHTYLPVFVIEFLIFMKQRFTACIRYSACVQFHIFQNLVSEQEENLNTFGQK